MRARRALSVSHQRQFAPGVLVKREECADGFDLVHPHSLYYRPIDGVKPPVWLPPGGQPYTQDWYKVSTTLAVFIRPDGEPAKTAPSALFIPILLN